MKDLKLLGKSEYKTPSKPNQKVLEVFENKNKNNNYEIDLYSSDFSSLCPITEQPDYASITIRYVPKSKCIETKSLKFYLASYRNTKDFNENIANKIYNDIIAICKLRKLYLKCEFAPRGGIRLSVEINYPN